MLLRTDKGGGASCSVRAFCAFREEVEVSNTLTVNVNAPLCDGVPVRTPVVAFGATAAGIVPEVRLHLYGLVPPLAEMASA